MLQTSRILVRPLSHAALAAIAAMSLLGLAGCGQPGSLYLPTEPAAAHRASLPKSLWPMMPEKNKPAAPTSPGTAPAPAPLPAAQPVPAPSSPQ